MHLHLISGGGSNYQISAPANLHRGHHHFSCEFNNICKLWMRRWGWMMMEKKLLSPIVLTYYYHFQWKLRHVVFSWIIQHNSPTLPLSLTREDILLNSSFDFLPYAELWLHGVLSWWWRSWRWWWCLDGNLISHLFGRFRKSVKFSLPSDPQFPRDGISPSTCNLHVPWCSLKKRWETSCSLIQISPDGFWERFILFWNPIHPMRNTGMQIGLTLTRNMKRTKSKTMRAYSWLEASTCTNSTLYWFPFTYQIKIAKL